MKETELKREIISGLTGSILSDIEQCQGGQFNACGRCIISVGIIDL